MPKRVLVCVPIDAPDCAAFDEAIKPWSRAAWLKDAIYTKIGRKVPPNGKRGPKTGRKTT